MRRSKKVNRAINSPAKASKLSPEREARRIRANELARGAEPVIIIFAGQLHNA